jgi:hypothetical protein
MVEGFDQAGVSRDVAMGYIHSHMPENFVFGGVHALLEGLSWQLEPPDSPSPSDKDLIAPPSFPKLTPTVPAPISLLRDMTYEFAPHIGPEATEHLVQAMLAADQYIRNKSAERLQKFQGHNQSEEGLNACDEIIASHRDQLADEDARVLLDVLAPTIRKYPPDELEEVFNEILEVGNGDINLAFQNLSPEDIERLQRQCEVEINLYLNP